MAEPDFSYSKENFIEHYDKLKELNFDKSDKEVDIFLDMLREGIPFAFSRFNDGEMSAFKKGDGERIGRTAHTNIDDNLRNQLIKAMSHEQKNYWVGMPCSVCFPDLYEIASKFVRKDYPYQTRAVALTNRNWGKFVANFPDAVKGKKLHWICSSDQNLQMLTDVFDLQFESRIDLPNLNAWEHYDEIKDRCDEFEPGSIVGFSCGPMSRILAPEWFSKRPDVTFFCIGSVYDPYTRNIWHACHKSWDKGFNETRRCDGCN